MNENISVVNNSSDQNVQSTSATYYLGYDSDGTQLNFYANYGGYTCIMQEIQG